MNFKSRKPKAEGEEMLVYTEIGITLKHVVTRTYSFPFNRAFPGLPSFPGGPGGPTMPRPLFRPFPPENMRESTLGDNLKEQHYYPRMAKRVIIYKPKK